MPTSADPYPALRRFAADPIMFVGGQRALLLQLAHPAIAAGVEHHSSFRRRPVTRLIATIDALILLVWGGPDEAEQARARIFAVHDRVHGSLSPPDDPTPSYPAGSRYSAHNPGLQRWVWATLVDTAFVIHRTFIGDLSPEETEAVYSDWCRFASVFTIEPASLPVTVDEFYECYHAELARLEVSATARELSVAILDPPLPFVPRSVRELSALATAGLLADELRYAYGLDWTDEHERSFAAACERIRRGWRLVPPQRRALPQLWLAASRATTIGCAAAVNITDAITTAAGAVSLPRRLRLARSFLR